MAAFDFPPPPFPIRDLSDEGLPYSLIVIGLVGVVLVLLWLKDRNDK